MGIEDSSGVTERLGSSASPLRSRTGCQQCRNRKRKCDEQRPRCLACVDRDLPCSWRREPRRPQVSRRQNKFNKDFAVPQEMRPLVTVFTVLSAPIQERLLSHFSVNSPLWLTSGGNTAVCSDIIMPIASHSPLVLNCVLALAAGDLAKYQPASSEMASLTCGFYGQAVAGINLALSHELGPSKSSSIPGEMSSQGDDLLLAIILLCVHEVVNFTSTTRIFPHLNAAAALCHSRCSSIGAPNFPLLGLLFELFYYIFTLTAFTHGHNLLLHLAPEVFTSPFLSGSEYKGVLLGQQCRDIFSVILRVSILRHDLVLAPAIDEPTASELRALQAQLEVSPAIRDAEAACQDDIVASELYRLACLIHIKKTLDPMLHDGSAAIQDLVSRFISALNSLPPTSPANNILCWPLFIAGMSSIAMSHRRLIIGRLRRNYESWWRSDILIRTADFLSANWRHGGATLEGEVIRCRDSYATQWPGLTVQAFDFPVVLL